MRPHVSYEHAYIIHERQSFGTLAIRLVGSYAWSYGLSAGVTEIFYDHL